MSLRSLQELVGSLGLSRYDEGGLPSHLRRTQARGKQVINAPRRSQLDYILKFTSEGPTIHNSLNSVHSRALGSLRGVAMSQRRVLHVHACCTPVGVAPDFFLISYFPFMNSLSIYKFETSVAQS